MKRIMSFASFLTIAFPALAFAQSAADLKNAAKTPDRILTYGMSYSQQRFSTLKQIDRQTVKRLVPAWSYSLDSSNGEESQALVLDGVMYITSHDKTVAIDAETGKEIWKTMVAYPPETTKVVCCGIVNRGGALFNGKFFRTMLDGRVQALDQKTGKEIWNTRSGDIAEGACDDGRAAGRQWRGHHRRRRLRIQRARLYRGLRRRDRQAPLAALHRAAAGRAGRRDLARQRGQRERRQHLDDGLLRSRSRSRLLGRRQSLALERARPQGRQSLHRHDHGGAAQDRRDGLALSDLAQRSLRL